MFPEHCGRHLGVLAAGFAATTRAMERSRFAETQERIFRDSIRFNILKWLDRSAIAKTPEEPEGGTSRMCLNALAGR